MNHNNQKILIVEDEPVSLKVLASYLKEAGFEVDSAEDGRKALSKLKASPNTFSAVVLDRLMPFMGGMELFEIMKKSPNLAKIPVVILTGIGEREDVIEAVEAGVFDYLVKPVEKELLIKLIGQATQRKEKNSETVH